MWSKIKAVLGAITDFLTFGRGMGWWSKKQSPTDSIPKGR